MIKKQIWSAERRDIGLLVMIQESFLLAKLAELANAPVLKTGAGNGMGDRDSHLALLFYFLKRNL